ncbi:MAG: hypothetical protein IPM83_15910 [Ignavibacteria bacterium]|nr:hypothetical protein [Ignavibacteria bacterium]
MSMLNNNVLDKSDFMTSAFPSPYGNALSGVFDLRMRNGNPEKYEFVGQIGFNGFEFGAEGPAWRKYVPCQLSLLNSWCVQGAGDQLRYRFCCPGLSGRQREAFTKLGEAGTLTLWYRWEE